VSVRKATARAMVASTATNAEMRGSLFISHATEDNDFAMWLGARLSAAGYDVWADVLRLKGGDDWERILEKALRTKASKMLWVATKAGCEKEGVRNEIHIATDVRKKIGDDAFIIPLKLEDCEAPFQAVHIQWIDFRTGWGSGLVELMEMLQGVPALSRAPGLNRESMTRWLAAQANRNAILETAPEVLVSNWLPVRQMPATMRYFVFSGAGAEDIAQAAVDAYTLPCVKHGLGFFAFGGLPDFRDTPSGISPRLVQEIPMDDFIGEGVRELNLQPREARNMLTVLVRMAFEAHLAGKGLSIYEFSSRTRGYWVGPLLMKGKERVGFDWKNGWKGSRNLTGEVSKGAAKYGWHYGVSAHARVEREPYVQLTPRLIFTESGTPIPRASKMHALRRSIPRAWRNDRWRDLLLAFLAWLSDGKEHIDVPVGGDRILRFGAMPLTMQAPVSIQSENDDADEDAAVELGDPVFEAALDEREGDDGEGD